MGCAPFDQAGSEDDGVREGADPRDVDLDHVTGLEREAVGRDEPGAGEEDAAGRDGVVAQEEADELLERALHTSGRRLAGEELAALGVRDPHADLERLVRDRGEDRGADRARPRVHLRLWEVERVRAFDVAGRHVVPDRDTLYRAFGAQTSPIS